MADQVQHWTDNEEVLERYVLGRIDAQSKGILDEHLEECARCREAVQRETELAAGAKRLGRAALKERLGRRLAAPARPGVPWPHVISAAAVLVIAVGVAMYTFWTPIESWYEGEMADVRPQVADTEARSSLDEEQVRQEPDRDDITRRNEALLEKIDRAKGEDQKIVQAPATADRLEPVEAEALREDKAFAATGAAAQTSAWIRGMIVPVPKDEQSKRTALPDARNEPSAEPAQAQPAPAQKARRQEGVSAPGVLSAELRQQPFEALPEAQQQVYATQAGRAVETLVEKTPEGLRLTLYADPPIPDDELRSARIEAVTSDSLIVVMPTQQIAYKIPPALGSVQGIQLKTK